MLALLTQPPSQSSPPVDAPDAPYSPTPATCEDANDTSRLASEGNLDKYQLMTADVNLFSVYQDLMQQNPGTHINDRVEEDGNWQKIWKQLVFMPNQRYHILYGRIRN